MESVNIQEYNFSPACIIRVKDDFWGLAYFNPQRVIRKLTGGERPYFDDAYPMSKLKMGIKKGMFGDVSIDEFKEACLNSNAAPLSKIQDFLNSYDFTIDCFTLKVDVPGVKVCMCNNPWDMPYVVKLTPEYPYFDEVLDKCERGSL